jgi:hypothetical protein
VKYLWRVDNHDAGYPDDYGVIRIRWARPGTGTVTCVATIGERTVLEARADVVVTDNVD